MNSCESEKNSKRRSGTSRLISLSVLRPFLVAAAGLSSASAQQTGDATAWLQFIGLELRQIHIEMLEQRAAHESDRLLQTAHALAALRLEQNKYRREEQSQKQQLAELDKQASDPGADSQARTHIQAVIGELASTADVTRVAYGTLTAREAELNERHCQVVRVKWLQPG
jgi:hypothetical protein